MNTDPSQTTRVSKVDRWAILLLAVVAPMVAFWIQTAWVFRREIRHYQALLSCVGEPGLWAVLLLEVLLGWAVLMIFRRAIIRQATVRWAACLCLCGVWTYVAFLIMPGVHR